MNDTLSFEEALHLIAFEPTHCEALELIAVLAERRQIDHCTEELLQDWVDIKWNQ